jgi:hypothetical protein
MGYKYFIIAAVLAGLCIGVPLAGAGDEPEDVINYAYSTWVAVGWM